MGHSPLPLNQDARSGGQARIDGVDAVLGSNEKFKIFDLINEYSKSEPSCIHVDTAEQLNEFNSAYSSNNDDRTRAFLKIQDGCDSFCSFCVIPYARGRARSREFNNILSEASQLIKAGYRELVLTGINVGTYQYKDLSIVEVVESLLELEGLDRLRLSSIEPTTIPDRLLTVMKEDQRLCHYLHIPLQSGSDDILKAMNRNYTTLDYADYIRRLQSEIPGICLGTDVMVGFPGETEDNFQDTFEFLRELPLAYFHVFSYSERPWAKSRKFSNPVQKVVVEERSRRLRELSNRKRRVFMTDQLGTIQKVLFEQEKKGWWKGLTDTYMRVKDRSSRNLKNQILNVQLNQIEDQEIAGTLV